MRVITLLTDFGIKDSYVAEMKGVILSLVSDVRIVDISHEVKPQNIMEASFIIENSFFYFPEKTVHLVVVDPGVGTEREIIVVNTLHYTFIGPDNGVLHESVIKDSIQEIRVIDSKRFRSYMLNRFKGNFVAERVFEGKESKTFHGRDIFAPLASFCFLDGNWNSFSVRKKAIRKISKIKPVVNKNEILGKVVYIDHFGNLITNISYDFLSKFINDYKKIEVFIKLNKGLVKIGRLYSTYSDVSKGEPLVLVDSRGYIELAVNGGNASNYFGVSGGEDIIIIFS